MHMLGLAFRYIELADMLLTRTDMPGKRHVWKELPPCAPGKAHSQLRERASGRRSAGSHFDVACEDADGSRLHAEAEQLLLAPGAWPADCLRLFGLAAGSLQARARHGRLRCELGESTPAAARLPAAASLALGLMCTAPVQRRRPSSSKLPGFNAWQ